MKNESKVTTKYQVVIPKQVREAARVKIGGRMLVQALGDMVILWPKKPGARWASSLLGLGKDMWKDIDPITYVRQERRTWQK